MFIVAFKTHFFPNYVIHHSISAIGYAFSARCNVTIIFTAVVRVSGAGPLWAR